MAGFQLNLVADSALAELSGGTEDMIRKLDLAAARALRKTAQWLRTHSSREISKELRITQSPIRHRYQIFSRGRGTDVKLWIGLDPIAVHYLGTPKEVPGGVAVGHRFYEDAFIGQLNGGRAMVFRRKGRERLPITPVRENWDGPAVSVLERWEKRAVERFAALFEQEAAYVFKSS